MLTRLFHRNHAYIYWHLLALAVLSAPKTGGQFLYSAPYFLEDFET